MSFIPIFLIMSGSTGATTAAAVATTPTAPSTASTSVAASSSANNAAAASNSAARPSNGPSSPSDEGPNSSKKRRRAEAEAVKAEPDGDGDSSDGDGDDDSDSSSGSESDDDGAEDSSRAASAAGMSSAMNGRPAPSAPSSSLFAAPASVSPAANATANAAANQAVFSELGVPIKGIPAIHTACVDGNLRMVEFLVNTREEEVEAQDIVGSRPLHVAACYGHQAVIRHLIECGADVNARDNYQSTPLVVASSAEAVELLVSFGANIDAKNVNNISARSISLGNAYVSLAIDQGLKKLERRRQVTQQLILEATNPHHRRDKELSALSALATLSTPTLAPQFAPSTPSLSPLHGPLGTLGYSLSPALGPQQLSLSMTLGNHGHSGKPGGDPLDADPSEDPLDTSRFPASLAGLVVDYLYPPVASHPSSQQVPRMSFSDNF